MTEEFVTIVSGLPRSGTSMMMQMLEAGGVPILKDDLREADDDNPRGYYEFERVKQIAQDQAWLVESKGKAVKMVSALLPQLPNSYRYKIVFMHRRMEEVLVSQKVMLGRKGKATDKTSDERMAVYFRNHLAQVEKWLEAQPNIEVLHVNYNEMLEDPLKQAKRINQFLENKLDVGKMVGAVDHSLYRERHTSSATPNSGVERPN